MLCRLCVTECDDFEEIFKGECLKIDVVNLIARWFTFQVSQDDPHSTILCKTCFESLNKFYLFCTSVEDAQEKWDILLDLEMNADEVSVNEDIIHSGEDDIEEQSIENEDEDEVESNSSSLLQEEEDEIYPPGHSSPKQCKSRKTRLSEEFDRLIASHTKLFCSECDLQLSNFKNLKRHFKDDHGKAGYMICCKRKFFRAADLADHINLHLNPEYFKCSQCDKCLSSRYSLDFHLKTFHVKGEAQRKFFQCDQCPKTCATKSILDRHMQAHSETKSEANDHVCTECGKGYATESKLKAHHFNVHTHVYSRMCHVCGRIVRGNKALERHQLQHVGIKPKVKCDICGVELSTKGILKAHIIALHPTDSSETHVCGVCGKNAPSKRALKYHMDYVHNRERSHNCNLCDKSFKRLQALKEHITTHTGDRLYECPHCPKTFKVRSNMHHHRKLKHPKEFEENRRNRTIRK